MLPEKREHRFPGRRNNALKIRDPLRNGPHEVSDKAFGVRRRTDQYAGRDESENRRYAKERRKRENEECDGGGCKEQGGYTGNAVLKELLHSGSDCKREREGRFSK